MFFLLFKTVETFVIKRRILINGAMQNFLFKSSKEDSPLKATDFGLSDYIKPGTFTLKEVALLSLLCCFSVLHRFTSLHVKVTQHVNIFEICETFFLEGLTNCDHEFL